MTRLTAADRLTRLLAVIPHVAGRGFVPLDEIAERFDYPRAELVADLTGVLPFVGVAPFTPDALIEVDVDDERVRIDYADWFARPLRLATDEALALLTAGKAVLAVDTGDDSGPLFRGLAKLGAALGTSDGTLAIHLGSAAEETLALLRTAVSEHRQVRLDYYSYGRDLRTQRVVEPWRFFADEGNWYVAGHCHAAAAERVFRVDRIREAVLLDTTFAMRTGATDPSVFAPGPDTPRVVLELASEARWVAAQYPHDAVVELPGGRLQVTLPVTAKAWLERLLVRLGDEADLVRSDGDLGADPRTDAVRRILARYEVHDRGRPVGP
jgi:proteasome accessory factor C